jgi:hypothetical protein
MAAKEITSIPAVGREMVERLTRAHGVRFTVTDAVGGVLASTGGHPRGHVVQRIDLVGTLEQAREFSPG